MNQPPPNPTTGPAESTHWGLFTPVPFARLYAGLALAQLLAGWLVPDLTYLTKPLLLLALSRYWWQQTRANRNRQAVLMQVALAFAWLGDVLLLVQRQNPRFFLLGLGAFLVMQVLYGFIFAADARQPDSRQLGHLVGLALFVGWVGSGIWPYLPADMTIPVGIYMLAITLMVYLALFRRGGVAHAGFVRVYAGAVLFLISDSCIAVNRFLPVNVSVGFLVMPAYIVAQYLIVTGLLAGRNGRYSKSHA